MKCWTLCLHTWPAAKTVEIKGYLGFQHMVTGGNVLSAKQAHQGWNKNFAQVSNAMTFECRCHIFYIKIHSPVKIVRLRESLLIELWMPRVSGDDNHWVIACESIIKVIGSICLSVFWRLGNAEVCKMVLPIRWFQQHLGKYATLLLPLHYTAQQSRGWAFRNALA